MPVRIVKNHLVLQVCDGFVVTLYRRNLCFLNRTIFRHFDKGVGVVGGMDFHKEYSP